MNSAYFDQGDYEVVDALPPPDMILRISRQGLADVEDILFFS